jgi:hypothetical protein
MPIRVLSAHPTNKISVDKMKPSQGASIESSSGATKDRWWVWSWWRPSCAESRDGEGTCIHAEMHVRLPGSTDVITRPASEWIEIGPEMRKETDDRRGVMVGGSTCCRRAKIPEAMAVWGPRPSIPERRADAAKSVGSCDATR